MCISVFKVKSNPIILMKKITLLIFTVLLNCSLFAQIQIDWLDIVEENGPNGNIELYASNSGLCPITLILDFDELKNLKIEEDLPVKTVIQNDKEQHLIATLVPKGNKSTAYNFSINYRLGNILHLETDEDYAYLLPFENGVQCTVGQGYNGRFSHGGLNAIDFDMEIGSKVCAARDGVIIAVKEDSDKGCKNAKCQSMANYVLVYHEDGTFASYVHLKKDGVLFEPGDKVKAGDVIAYSGNTGWSSGPHLHFEVYKPGEQGNIAIQTKFRITKDSSDFLKERATYTSYHP